MKPLIKFTVTIPDTKTNMLILDDLGDTIAAADEIATAIGDLGFQKVDVKNADG